MLGLPSRPGLGDDPLARAGDQAGRHDTENCDLQQQQPHGQRGSSSVRQPKAALSL